MSPSDYTGKNLKPWPVLLDNPKTINVNLNPKEIKYFTYSMNHSGNSLTEIKESEALLLLKELRSQ